MTSLNEALANKAPLVWVSTQDSHRVVENIVLSSQQKVFRLDPFEGLQEFSEERWRVVLMLTEDGPSPIYDPMVSLVHCYRAKSILIMENADSYAKDFLAHAIALQGRYRDALFADDVTHSSSSIYFIGTGDPPEEFGRNLLFVESQYPSAEEISGLYANIGKRIPNALGDDANVKRLVSSSVGLSESEIVSNALSLLKSKGFIDAETLNAIRTRLLKAGANIDLIRPNVTFDSLGGMDLAKELIRSSVSIWNNPDTDVKPMNKMLFIGVPGAGKSALCKAVANELQLDLARTGVTHQMSKWIGESERNMRHTLQAIVAMAPICVWIDELGRDLSGSGTSNDGGTTDRVHGEFLTGLQELPDSVFLMAAANRVDGLPPEMLRQGRFDEILFIGLPSIEERADIFRIYLGDDIDKFDLNALCESSEGFVGGEIESAVEKMRFAHASGTGSLDTDHALEVLGESRNLVLVRHTHAIMDMYKRAQTEWKWASSSQRRDSELVLNGQYGPLKSMPNPTGAAKKSSAKHVL